MSFNDLGLTPELARAVAEKGYTTPTPIQRAAIPGVLAGRDVLAGALLRAGRGRPHARHGLHSRDPPDPQAPAARAPDADVLGDLFGGHPSAGGPLVARAAGR